MINSNRTVYLVADCMIFSSMMNITKGNTACNIKDWCVL